ncbi:hypothetical protein C9E88_012925 [Acinetobacter cumulans]|nr:hypothetical protein C9E88_012925 [Acinetobacter cumulans]
MFITSFEEQNITYRSCSNLRIHLFMSNGFKTLIEGQRVQFSVSKSQRGFQASEIIAIDN